MLNQTTVIRDLPLQQPYFGISLLDQAASFDNQACAFACQGCELFVSICEISAGSGITCSLGVSGGGGAEVALQACNANSISSAAGLQGLELLRVVMGVFLLGSAVLNYGLRFLFCICLRLLSLRRSRLCM